MDRNQLNPIALTDQELEQVTGGASLNAFGFRRTAIFFRMADIAITGINHNTH